MLETARHTVCVTHTHTYTHTLVGRGRLIGGLIGAGPMIGIASWQTLCTALGPAKTMHVVTAAALLLILVQAALWLVLRPHADRGYLSVR